MIIAKKADKSTVVRILTDAFIDNGSVNYIIRKKKKVEEIQALMEYSFDTCLLFGRVVLSDKRDACALILYPQNKTLNLQAILLDIKLIFKAIGLSRIKLALNRESKIKALQPNIPMAYLWFIGVDPNNQNRGVGTQLLNEIIRESDLQGMPLFLETSTLENLPWYQKLGFELYNQLNLSYILYFLRR